MCILLSTCIRMLDNHFPKLQLDLDYSSHNNPLSERTQFLFNFIAHLCASLQLLHCISTAVTIWTLGTSLLYVFNILASLLRVLGHD